MCPSCVMIHSLYIFTLVCVGILGSTYFHFLFVNKTPSSHKIAAKFPWQSSQPVKLTCDVDSLIYPPACDTDYWATILCFNVITFSLLLQFTAGGQECGSQQPDKPAAATDETATGWTGETSPTTALCRVTCVGCCVDAKLRRHCVNRSSCTNSRGMFHMGFSRL